MQESRVTLTLCSTTLITRHSHSMQHNTHDVRYIHHTSGYFFVALTTIPDFTLNAINPAIFVVYGIMLRSAVTTVHAVFLLTLDFLRNDEEPFRSERMKQCTCSR